jgi:hypothetical protein
MTSTVIHSYMLHIFALRLPRDTQLVERDTLFFGRFTLRERARLLPQSLLTVSSTDRITPCRLHAKLFRACTGSEQNSRCVRTVTRTRQVCCAHAGPCGESRVSLVDGVEIQRTVSEDHWAVQMVNNSFSSPSELKIIFSCVSFHFGYLRFVLTSFWICSSMLLQTVTAGLSIEDIVWTAR